MKVLTYIPNSTIHPFSHEDAYWVESNQQEFMQYIYPLLHGSEKEKIDRSPLSYIQGHTTPFAIEGHIYFLINRDWSKTLIEGAYLPYAGQWNAYSPFRQIQPFTFHSQKEFQGKTYVGPTETNQLWFSELIKDKFSEEFNRIRVILDRHRIDYRFLKGTRDIWCRDYLPVQISEKDFVQFRYEPSYLETEEELATRSDPEKVNAENGFTPVSSKINLDGGNVVRYKEKVMITARVFRENEGLGLSKDQLVKQLGHDLRAHVIIVPEHRGDQIDHADGNVRFRDEQTVLINDLSLEYKYWRTGMAKIKEYYGFNFIEVPWFIPKRKKNSLSAIGFYINYLEIGNLIILPKFEMDGNRDQDAFNLFQRYFPDRQIEQVNINAIAEEGGLLNCISWSMCVPEM